MPTNLSPTKTPASATTGAGLNIAPGTAPTSPVNGDVWTTSAGIYAQINGATVGPLSAGGVSKRTETLYADSAAVNGNPASDYFTTLAAKTVKLTRWFNNNVGSVNAYKELGRPFSAAATVITFSSGAQGATATVSLAAGDSIFLQVGESDKGVLLVEEQ